jgi:hypothetical protein
MAESWPKSGQSANGKWAEERTSEFEWLPVSKGKQEADQRCLIEQ